MALSHQEATDDAEKSGDELWLASLDCFDSSVNATVRQFLVDELTDGLRGVVLIQFGVSAVTEWSDPSSFDILVGVQEIPYEATAVRIR